VAVDYVLQAMEAIAEAHSIGVVHRDLKPGNLFLSKGPDGSDFVKVLDFGISKATDPQNASGESSLTQTSAVMGSPFYMSPEQMLSARNVSAASDIWAIGVILHQLITGTLPFAAATPEKVCSRVLNGSPTLLRDVNPNLPAGLEQVVARCLQRRPQNRFANVTDLAIKLIEFAPEHSRRSLTFISDCIDPSESAASTVEVKMPVQVDVPDSPTVVYVAADSKFSGKRAVLTGVFGLAMFAMGLGVGLFVSGRSNRAMLGSSKPVAALSVPVVESAKPPDEAPDLPQPDLEQAPVEMDLDQDDSRSRRDKQHKNTKKEKPASDETAVESEKSVRPESADKPGSTEKPETTATPQPTERVAPAEKSDGTVKPENAAVSPPSDETRKRPSKPKHADGNDSVPSNPYNSE